MEIIKENKKVENLFKDSLDEEKQDLDMNKTKEVLKDDSIERLEKIVEEAIEEVSKDEIPKEVKEEFEQMQKSCKIEDHSLNEISRDIHQLSKDIHTCGQTLLKGNNTILDFRISSHKANVHVGNELKDIHKFQSKFVFWVLLANSLVFTTFGAVLHSNKDDISPYVNSAINFVKTANAISK